MTGYHLGLTLFTTTLWALPSSQFFLLSKAYAHLNHEQPVSPGEYCGKNFDIEGSFKYSCIYFLGRCLAEDTIVQTNLKCHFSFFPLAQIFQVHHSVAMIISLLFSTWNNSEVPEHQGPQAKAY